MILIILIVVLALLKYLQVSFMASIGWGWIVGLLGVAFVWFEFIERILGLDKKKAHEKYNQIQRDRAKRQFDRQKK